MSFTSVKNRVDAKKPANRSASLGRRVCAIALAFVALQSVAWADYSQNRATQAFIDEMVKKHKFERAELQQVFSHTERQEKVLESISKPAEKVLTWADYRRIFLTEERIKDGRQFLREHKPTLERAQQVYGVPPELVVAILGVETKYGRIKGSYRAVDALATLAFDYPPRAKFFRSELEQLLLLAREQGFDPLSLNGSYAGAMGYGQFIPSSYRNFAVDFDGDKVADIWNNPVDAIGSIANYFSENGWRTGTPVATQVSVQGEAYQKYLHGKQRNYKPKYTVAQLKKAGVNFEQTLPGDMKAILLQLEGAEGPQYWVGYQNFYAITRYNISHLYAMAVHQLSREILNEQSRSN